MTRPPLSRVATDLLAEEQLEPRAASADAEARAIAAIASRIEARARRRRTVRLAGGLALAASLVLVASQLWRSGPADREGHAAAASTGAALAATATQSSEGSVLERRGALSPLDHGGSLVAGDRVSAGPSAPAAVGLADGSRLTVDPGSSVALASLTSTRRFVLRGGSVRADVSKLAHGDRFVVETVDAEVEVHGTSFRVALAPSGAPACEGSRTQVHVFEGVVAVRSRGAEVRLHAGDDWPRGCSAASATAAPSLAPTAAVPAGTTTAAAPAGTTTAAAPAGTTTAAAPAAAPNAAAPAVSAPAIAAAAVAAPAPAKTAEASAHRSSGTLAEQNRIFGEAAEARRRGDATTALAAYDRLLATYPDSFLAESAAVERMRVLTSLDRARARDAARLYLSRYPNGFARAEAERIGGR